MRRMKKNMRAKNNVRFREGDRSRSEGIQENNRLKSYENCCRNQPPRKRSSELWGVCGQGERTTSEKNSNIRSVGEVTGSRKKKDAEGGF